MINLYIKFLSSNLIIILKNIFVNRKVRIMKYIIGLDIGIGSVSWAVVRNDDDCKLAGLTTLRSEIKDLTRDEAIVYMVESNFQRTTILPSEKAFAYKMRLEAIKRQGKRTDLTSSPVGTKLRTDEIIAQESSDSRNQIHRCETL